MRPDVSDAAERLYVAIGSGLTRDDEDADWALLTLVDAVSIPLQALHELADDSDDGPGWSALLDVDRAPAAALPWLAQFVGVRLPPGLDEAAQRLAISETAGFKRGSVSAIAGAARQYLTGTKRADVLERTSSAYTLTVRTYTAETPDPVATEAAVRAQKPAGLVLTYVNQPGPSIDQLVGTIDGQVGTIDNYANTVP